jgi:hypothetical protein
MRPPCNAIITIFHWNDQQLHAFMCGVEGESDRNFANTEQLKQHCEVE